MDADPPAGNCNAASRATARADRDYPSVRCALTPLSDELYPGLAPTDRWDSRVPHTTKVSRFRTHERPLDGLQPGRGVPAAVDGGTTPRDRPGVAGRLRARHASHDGPRARMSGDVGRNTITYLNMGRMSARNDPRTRMSPGCESPQLSPRRPFIRHSSRGSEALI